MVETVGIKIGHEKVGIIGKNVKEIFADNLGFGKIIPGFKLLSHITQDQFKTTLFYNNTDKTSYKIKEELSAVLSAPINIINAEALTYAAFPLTERLRQMDGYLTSHAASVALDEKGILILGKEGQGKTTLAIELCRNFGSELIGNDLTIIGLKGKKLVISEGTKHFNLRYESILRNIPALSKHFQISDLDTWRHKKIVETQKLGIKQFEGEAEIALPIVIHIDNSKPKLFVKEEKNDTVVKLVLYENFSRYIRNSCIPLLDKNNEFLTYLPSFDNEKLYQFRTKLIENLMGFPLLYISGNIDNILHFINKNLI